MPKILYTVVKDKIQSLRNNDFQNFIERIYLIYYNSDFLPMKQKRDKGCDGIITSEKTILAIYGPEKRDLPSFKKKVLDDHNKYKLNWATSYPNWQVVYNMSFTASEIEFLDSLKSNAQKISPDHLMEIFNSLKWFEKKEIVGYLNIDDIYFQQDALETVIEDLISETSKDIDSIPYDRPIYLMEKIELNYEKDQVEAAKDEHQDSMVYFSTIRSLLADYSDQEQFALKTKIRTDYYALSGAHSAKVDQLTQRYSVKYKSNDIYKTFVKVVLLYYFENCLIGQKTSTERAAL